RGQCRTGILPVSVRARSLERQARCLSYIGERIHLACGANTANHDNKRRTPKQKSSEILVTLAFRGCGFQNCLGALSSGYEESWLVPSLDIRVHFCPVPRHRPPPFQRPKLRHSICYWDTQTMLWSTHLRSRSSLRG